MPCGVLSGLVRISPPAVIRQDRTPQGKALSLIPRTDLGPLLLFEGLFQGIGEKRLGKVALGNVVGQGGT